MVERDKRRVYAIPINLCTHTGQPVVTPLHPDTVVSINVLAQMATPDHDGGVIIALQVDGSDGPGALIDLAAAEGLINDLQLCIATAKKNAGNC